MHSEEDRLSLVLKEQYVDNAVLGDEEQSTYKVVQDLNPDLICLGYDQEVLGEDLKLWFEREKRTIPCVVLQPYKETVFHTSLLREK